MRISVLIFIIFISGLTNNSFAQLKLSTPYPPQIFHGSDLKSVVYEIHLMDSLQRPIDFLDFKICSADKMLLQDSIYGTIPKKSEKNRYLKYVWLDIDQTPKVLIHHIKYKIGDEIYDFTSNIMIEGDSVISIGLPVKKGIWYMQGGPSATSYHTICTIATKTRYDTLKNSFKFGYSNQRFAFDFARLGADGFLYKNDGHKNSDHYCYGDSVIAVANGTIVGVLDSIKENNYPSTIIENSLDGDKMTGNLVMLDIGNGIIASYAHLMTNSIYVKVGDFIHKGDFIGRIGNSGNSTAPHFHFHLSKPDYRFVNASNIIGMFWLSEGISFVFENYKKYSVLSGKFVDVDGEYDVNSGKFIVNGDKDFKSEPFILSNPKNIKKSLPYENEIIDVK